MNKYDEMSDFEINYLVAKIATDGEVIGKADMWPTNNGNAVQIIYKVGISGEYKDYCNNPADMWPIIVSNNISIAHYPSGDAMTFIQGGGFMKFKHESKNALMSAAITFLMMKDMTE